MSWLPVRYRYYARLPRLQLLSLWLSPGAARLLLDGKTEEARQALVACRREDAAPCRGLPGKEERERYLDWFCEDALLAAYASDPDGTYALMTAPTTCGACSTNRAGCRACEDLGRGQEEERQMFTRSQRSRPEALPLPLPLPAWRPFSPMLVDTAELPEGLYVIADPGGECWLVDILDNPVTGDPFDLYGACRSPMGVASNSSYDPESEGWQLQGPLLFPPPDRHAPVNQRRRAANEALRPEGDATPDLSLLGHDPDLAQAGDDVSWQHGTEENRRRGKVSWLHGVGEKRISGIDRTGAKQVTVKASRLRVEEKAPRDTLLQVLLLELDAVCINEDEARGLEEAILQWMRQR